MGYDNLRYETEADGDAREAAVEKAADIAGFPQETVRTDRAAVYDGLGEPSTGV